MADVPKMPSAEDLIREAASNGWDFFHHPMDRNGNPQRRAGPEKTQRIAVIAAVLWDNVPEFRELMEFLLDASMRRATFVAQLGLPMDQAYGYGVQREGQNSMMFAIMKLIAQGRNQQAPKERDA